MKKKLFLKHLFEKLDLCDEKNMLWVNVKNMVVFELSLCRGLQRF